MADSDHKDNRQARLSRRAFIGIASSAGASLIAGSAVFAQTEAEEPPLSLDPSVPRSRVVRARFPGVVVDSQVHRHICREMLEGSITKLTGKATAREAWRQILKPSDVIGIKFNRSGQAQMLTTDIFGETLIESLVKSGWSADRIVCIEAPPGLEERLQTTRARSGYQSEVTQFASGEDQLANVLSQVTALIDVPYLKSHGIAGLSGCLKNLSHGLIKHPARFHANECSPYIADIVGVAEIRSKLRLCLIDAMRVVFRDGPKPSVGNVTVADTLIAAFDPVAADTVGLDLLNGIRKDHRLPPLEGARDFLPQLADAHRRNLGIALTSGIDLVYATPS